MKMSAKLETRAVEGQRASESTSSKISMFKGKPDFVIPKNKFSGSLVPIFKPVKNPLANDATVEGTATHLHRKTKWGPDLTLDSSVRRARALAYQARVDQITQLLKSGSLGTHAQNSKPARDAPASDPQTMQIEFKKLHSLELERREAIGEILKLNPSYKAPSDYQPVVREARVPIPVKEHPDYNFLGLVYGPDGEIQRRLEKETGTRIQVCGTKSETKEMVEVSASEGSELMSSCEELFVRISSDTYEKADAAASLIELLLSSVSVKHASSTASASVSVDNAQAYGEGQDIATTHAISTAMAKQDLQPGAGPISTSSQGPFQPYPNSWLPAGQYNSPSGPAYIPSSMAFPFNPSLPHPLYGLGPPASHGFGSSHQSTAVLTPRLHTSGPVMPTSFMPPSYPLGQTGHQPNIVGSPRVPAPQLAERNMTPLLTSPGWGVRPALQSLVSGSFTTTGSQPFAASPNQFPSSQLGPAPSIFVPSQLRSSSPLPSQGITPPQAQIFNPLSNSPLRPTQNPLPPASALHAPSFTPLKHMGPIAPGSTLRGSGGFSFQPDRPQGAPSQSLPGPGLHFASQRPASTPLPPAPQGPSFRPALLNTIQQPIRQNFPGPPIGNQMGPRPVQFGPPSADPNMGPRHLGPVPQAPNAGGPFSPRVGNSLHYQQSYPAPPLGQRGGNNPANLQPSPSGRPQVYDPFSPTSISAAQPQGSNGIARKQDSDPEYEDLMASVGVK